jgi:hypothetical protein
MKRPRLLEPGSRERALGVLLADASISNLALKKEYGTATFEVSVLRRVNVANARSGCLRGMIAIPDRSVL